MPYSSPMHAFAVRAALEAGPAIMKVYAASVEVQNKEDGSPITQADRTANDIILSHLSGTPYPVITEESRPAGSTERKGWNRVWLVDPLDGTREFIRGNGEFTVNIALTEMGRPIMGVILAPVSQTLWLGIVGDGVYQMTNTGQWATGNPGFGEKEFFQYARRIAPVSPGRMAGQPQSTPSDENRAHNPDRADTVTIGVSRSHKEAKTEALIREISKRYGHVRIHQVGSSLKFCAMAEGKMTIYPRCTPIYEWDTAAGHAILKAAGGEVFSLETYQPLEYNKEDLHTPPFIAFSSLAESDRYFAEFPL